MRPRNGGGCPRCGGPGLHWLGMRLFVGIALADGVARELAELVGRLRRAARGSGAGGLRWTGPESWHITLQFLGNANHEQFDCLNARLGEVRAAPVPARLGELGSFDRAGVLFVDVAVTDELAALQKKVVDATSRCGFVAETRPFHPHITLARTAGSKGARGQGSQKALTLQEMVAQSRSASAFSGFKAREFLLYESHTAREGARYEARVRFALAGS